MVMEMDGSRRPFDRPRETSIKKPRLTDELDRGTNPNNRPFPQRAGAAGANTVFSSRFRTKEKESERSDLGRGGYQPQTPQHQELVIQYKSALAELTFNSKPIITNLTIIAGENVHAAKAIAATICSNILEVPSEQKLPSLYLLDSIVKNIGREYIRYFAARLPEVFCKAYRQVDPSVHPSMRHLFGTWKGVFPPEPLQMIEKELRFVPAVNGSSSAAATLRSDSQSQRPPHSIHVNPKYLERQRLQQSSRAKGISSDINGAMANSTEDMENLDGAGSMNSERPWVDPAVKIHNIQHSNRDALSDTVHEKGIGISFGGNEYGSELPRNSSSGIGRSGGKVTELGYDKAWHKTGGGVSGAVAGQRNGFSSKHDFPKLEGIKSLNIDGSCQSRQSFSNIRSTGMSNSWKNSEEEEFMWDNMNSGLIDHDDSNLSKDSWTPDDVEIPELHSSDGLIRKSGQSEGYASTLGGLSNSLGSSVVRPNNRARMGSSQVGSPGIGFLASATTGSAGIAAQQRGQSIGTTPPSGQSPLHHYPPSPTLTAFHPHRQLQNLAEQEHPQTLKISEFSRGLHSQHSQESSTIFPPNVPVSNVHRSQPKDLRGMLPARYQPGQCHLPSQQRQPDSTVSETGTQPLTQVSNYVSQSTMENLTSDNLKSLVAETSVQSTTSSLLAEVIKSGILSNKTITSSLANQSFQNVGNLASSGIQPPIPNGPPPTKMASPGSRIVSPSSTDLSNDNSLLTNKSERKAGQPRLSLGPPPSSSTIASVSVQTSNAVNNASNPISNLLSSLVSKGLISANTESPTGSAEMLDRLQDQSQAISTSTSLPDSPHPSSEDIHISSTRDEVSCNNHVKKSATTISHATEEIKNLLGFEFKSDVMRKLHPSVIQELFGDLPHCCGSCGFQLKCQAQLDRHLEWHASRQPEQNGGIRASRGWYTNSCNWVSGKTEFPFNCKPTDSAECAKTDKGDLMVPADESQCVCIFCGDLFEDFYSQESNEWMFKGAVYLTGKLGANDATIPKGPIVHVKCISEKPASDLGLHGGIKMEKDDQLSQVS